ncbi:MAG: hypothetical protein ABI629_12630 [bacterium]
MKKLVVAAIALSMLAGPAVAQTLSILKTGVPDPVIAGNLLTYTMTGTNDGPGASTNFTISDPLPSLTVFISAVASPGASLVTPAVGVNGVVTSVWNAAGGTTNGLTPNGTSRTLTAMVRVCPEAGCGSVDNTATASADGATSDNEEISTTVDVVGDLSITKSGPTEATRLTPLTYTLAVQNAGPSVLTAAVVTDTLPPGVAATSVISSFPGAMCSILPGNSVVTCTLTVGAANQCTTTFPTSGTIIVGATVLPSAQAGQFQNVATIEPGECGTDSDPSDNTAILPLRIFASNRAPVASSLGLAALAGLLAAAGAMRLRRGLR